MTAVKTRGPYSRLWAAVEGLQPLWAPAQPPCAPGKGEDVVAGRGDLELESQGGLMGTRIEKRLGTRLWSRIAGFASLQGTSYLVGPWASSCRFLICTKGITVLISRHLERKHLEDA